MSGTGPFQSSFRESLPKKVSIHDPRGSTTSKVGDSSKLLATSSQASLQAASPEVTKSVNHATLPAKTPGANTGALPEEVTLLQKELTKTMGGAPTDDQNVPGCLPAKTSL